MARVVENMLFRRFEPKQRRLFLMQIDGIPAYMVYASARPSFNFDVGEVHHLNTRFRYKGKITWEPITITLYDPIEESGAMAVYQWVLAHHDPTSGRDGYQDVYKKNIQLLLLDPQGTVIEQWTFHGAFISNVNPGDLDFSDAAGLLNIQLTIQYDYATLDFSAVPENA